MRLSQWVNELSDSLSEEVEGTSGTPSTEVAELREKLARSEKESVGLRLRCTWQADELAEEKQHISEQWMQLEEEREARKDLQEQLCQASNAVQQIQSETELLRLKAVADENKKWEEREARWGERGCGSWKRRWKRPVNAS